LIRGENGTTAINRSQLRGEKIQTNAKGRENNQVPKEKDGQDDAAITHFAEPLK